MGGLPGLSAIADVQARIASIEARFQADQPATPTAQPSSNALTSAPDFATALAQATASAGSTTPGTGSATQANGATSAARATFAKDLLASIGAPQTPENLRAIEAWAQAEGTKASNNPLATTRTAPGTTNFNSVGVKNYPSYVEGVQATADTLRNGLYGDILDALGRGTSADEVARAVASSRWGTGDRIIQALQTI